METERMFWNLESAVQTCLHVFIQFAWFKKKMNVYIGYIVSSPAFTNFMFLFCYLIAV